MKKLLSYFVVIALLFNLTNCGKKNKLADAKLDNFDVPSWVLDPYVKDGVAAVGIAAPSKGGFKFQIAAAELDAKANIASTIQSEVSRITKNSMKSAKVNEEDDVEEFFAQATKDVVKNLPLSGVKRINIFKDKEGTLYIHMVLRNEDFSKYLKNGRNDLLEKLKKSNLSRDNIKKSEDASKELFDELDRERGAKTSAVDLKKDDAKPENKDEKSKSAN